MRKILCLLSLAPVLLLSCSLQIPEKVQVKWSPNFQFAASFDIGEQLNESFKKDDFKTNDDIYLLECSNTEIVTFLVYKEAFNENLSVQNELNDMIDIGSINTSFTITDDKELKKQEIKIPAMNFDSDKFNFDNFTFDQSSIKSKLYISGSPMVNVLTVKLTKGEEVLLNETKAIDKKSNIDVSKETYDKTELPDGGIAINIPFDGKEELTITCTISVKQGETFYTEWMNSNSAILVELAVLLPFKFKATIDNAEIKLPDDIFSNDKDLFGRESPGSDDSITDMLERLEFAMKMNTSPFNGASLIVESANIKIESTLSGNSLGFAIDEATMAKINSPQGYPFAPSLKLVFKNSGTLSFPKEFIIKEISFKAKINYTYDLKGGIN